MLNAGKGRDCIAVRIRSVTRHRYVCYVKRLGIDNICRDIFCEYKNSCKNWQGTTWISNSWLIRNVIKTKAEVLK